MKKFKKVEVIWIDAQSSTDGLYIDDIKNMKPIRSYSLGYLVYECDKYIVLSFLNFGHGLMKHHQCIPRGMIKKIREVDYVD